VVGVRDGFLSASNRRLYGPPSKIGAARVMAPASAVLLPDGSALAIPKQAGTGVLERRSSREAALRCLRAAQTGLKVRLFVRKFLDRTAPSAVKRAHSKWRPRSSIRGRLSRTSTAALIPAAPGRTMYSRRGPRITSSRSFIVATRLALLRPREETAADSELLRIGAPRLPGAVVGSAVPRHRPSGAAGMEGAVAIPEVLTAEAAVIPVAAREVTLGMLQSVLLFWRL